MNIPESGVKSETGRAYWCGYILSRLPGSVVAQLASSESGGIPVKAPGTSKFRPATAFFVGSNLFDLMHAEPLHPRVVLSVTV